MWFLLDVVRAGHLFIPDTAACIERPQHWGHGSGIKIFEKKGFSGILFQKHVPGKNRMPKRARSKPAAIPLEAALKKLADSIDAKEKSKMHARILMECNYKPVEKAEQPVSAAPLETPLFTAVHWEQYGNAQGWPSHNITLPQAQELESQTQEQAAIQLWRTERATRITASHLGEIIRRKRDINEAIIASVYSKAGFRLTKYMRMGTKNESVAITGYQEQENVQEFPVGLCVNPDLSILSASQTALSMTKPFRSIALLK